MKLIKLGKFETKLWEFSKFLNVAMIYEYKVFQKYAVWVEYLFMPKYFLGGVHFLQLIHIRVC